MCGWFRDAGHWVAYEAPETVNAMLLEMLSRTRPSMPSINERMSRTHP